MGKTKIPATGEGYLGEIMVHRLSRAVGIVENVVEAKAGWPPEISLKLPDGSIKKGKLSDFREPSKTERETIPQPKSDSSETQEPENLPRQSRAKTAKAAKDKD